MYELHRADPPWEVNSQSACQTSHILWNQNMHHHVNTSPTTCKYPQPHESRPHFQIHNTKIHFKLSFHRHSDFAYGPFQLKMYVDFTSLLHRLHTQSILPSLIFHPNNFSRRVETMAFLVNKFSLVSCYVMWLKVWLCFYCTMCTTKYYCV